MIALLSMDIYNILWNALSYYIIFNITYYLSNFVLFVSDCWGIYASKKINHRMQDMIAVYKKCLSCVLINTLIASIGPSVLMAWSQHGNNEFFSPGKCITDIALSLILIDILLYICHRIFHIPFLYKLFHKKHHEITAPVGFSSLYMTITDFYFGNILPTFLPMYLMGAHPITTHIWLIGVIINTTFFAHSGYYIADYHDKHHSLFNKNYGAHIFMDKLFGTYSD